MELPLRRASPSLPAEWRVRCHRGALNRDLNAAQGQPRERRRRREQRRCDPEGKREAAANEPGKQQAHHLAEPAERLQGADAGIPWHCQLKRLWYARRVGGVAARVGNSFARLSCCPAQAERGRKKALWVR